MASVVVLGASGRLGYAICHAITAGWGLPPLELHTPSRRELDLVNPSSVRSYMALTSPDLVIHCAGYANALRAETDRAACWAVNVEGTRNVVNATAGARLVYISSDYVFDGAEGNYSETDPPNPINFYGVTKLAGEMLVSQHPDALILRAPFRHGPPWPWDRAFIDQWTSCDFVAMRAPEIVKAALRWDVTGILHIGGERRSVYEIAISASPEVGKMKRAEQFGLKIPRDTSLDSSRWHALCMQEAACASAR